jgi:hypothetical protein
MIVIVQCSDSRDNLVVSFSKKDPSAHEHSSILIEELTRMREDELGEEMETGEVQMRVCMYLHRCSI